jgi:GcrA cell cycle regulator
MTRSGVTGVRRPRAQKKAEKKERTTILRIISGFKSLRVIKTTTSEVGPLRCAEIEPLHVDMLDLSRDQCHYPYGDGPFTFCGQPAHQGSSYCTAHHFLCWTPARRQQERARAA